MVDFVRDVLLAFARVHVLYHASEEPVFGTGMMTELRRHGYALGPGTIYPLLHRLEADGLLVCRAKVVGGKARKYYAITGEGRRNWKQSTPSSRSSPEKSCRIRASRASKRARLADSLDRFVDLTVGLWPLCVVRHGPLLQHTTGRIGLRPSKIAFRRCHVHVMRDTRRIARRTSPGRGAASRGRRRKTRQPQRDRVQACRLRRQIEPRCVGPAHDAGELLQGRVVQAIFRQEGVEAAQLADMAHLDPGDVIRRGAGLLRRPASRSAAGTYRNSASRSMKRWISQGQAMRSIFGRSRVTHFMMRLLWR